MTDPDQAAWYIKMIYHLAEHIKEYMIPVAIGLGYLVWRLLKWLGLGMLDDVATLKRTAATTDQLKECNQRVRNEIHDIKDEIIEHITRMDERNEQRIKDVHHRIDEFMRPK